MKKFILKKEQLNEYIESKKVDKVFYIIIERLYMNNKLLTENVSYKKINQSVINDCMRKKIITQRVAEMLIKYKIIDNNYEII